MMPSAGIPPVMENDPPSPNVSWKDGPAGLFDPTCGPVEKSSKPPVTVRMGEPGGMPNSMLIGRSSAVNGVPVPS